MTTNAETTLPGPSRLAIENREAFQQAAVEAIEGMGDGGGVLVIDMTSTEFVDTAGLGAMASIHRRALEAGVEIRLLNPNEEVTGSLELARLDELFTTGDPES